MTMPYRPSAFRKQNHGDFSRRVNQIDPQSFRKGIFGCSHDTAKPHVVGAALLGFGWAYMAAAIGGNRNHIEAALRQGNLSSEAQHWIISALAAALAASLVMLSAHVLRAVVTGGARRKNSRGLLLGAMLAFALFYTPDVVWQTGFGMLDGRSQDFLQAASDMVESTFTGLNIDQISFTSSRGY